MTFAVNPELMKLADTLQVHLYLKPTSSEKTPSLDEELALIIWKLRLGEYLDRMGALHPKPADLAFLLKKVRDDEL